MDLTRPHAHSLSPHGLTIAGWVGFLLAGGIFMAVAWNVAAHRPIVVLDSAIASWFHGHLSDFWTHLMLVVSAANGIGASALWSVLFAAWLARIREWYWILTLTLATVGGVIVNVTLKTAYERARPHFEDPIVMLGTYSFPSGHTAAATIFYGTLAAFLVTRYRKPRLRVAIVLAAMAMVVLVAVSRMYLGAHYFSDVVAAAASSTVWLVLCLSGVHALVRQRMDAR
jgi:membrane-associated phospholipid phosphatase